MSEQLVTYPTVAIVILNWNGRDFLRRFLPSVLRTTYSHCRIVVADNASTDDSLQVLEQEFPTVERLVLLENYGFARGYNEAMRQVKADYYVLLNSDVEVTPGWIEPMVELLESNQRIAVCAPKLHAVHQPTHFEYAGGSGGWIDAYGYPFARGRVFDVVEEDSGQYDDAVPVWWATGAALMVRADLYHALGGLDSYFFAHQEEIDFCWRVQRAGWMVYVCPASLVYHVGGGALPKHNAHKTFLNFRNNLIMLAKNLPAGTWRRLYLNRLVLDKLAFLKELAGLRFDHAWAIVRAHAGLWRWYRTVRKTETDTHPRGWPAAGVLHGSLVWRHFVKKQRHFSEIVGGK